MPPVVIAVVAVAAYAYGYVLVAAVLFAAAVSMAAEAPEYNNDAVNPVAAQDLTTSANQARKVIYGEAVVGGQIIGYRKIVSGGNEYHYMAIHIAGHPCESVEIYEIEGKTPDEFGTAVSAEFHLGDQTTASANAVANIEGWTTEHVGFGLTNAYLKIRIDPDIFPNGVNQIKFKVRGKKVYDPRLDSTAGGAGSHIADDSTTWAWSANPTLCSYDYVRHHGYRPIPSRRIPWDFVALAANYCDEQAAYTDKNGDPQSETRFTCNGALNNALKPGDGLKYLLSSHGAKIYRPNGKIYIKPAMYAGPASVTVTPDDFVKQPNYQPHRPERERCNLVRGEYVDPELKYQVTDAPVTTNAQYVADDATELEHNLKLYLTNSQTVAQRLCKRHLERNHAGFVGEVALKGIRLDVTPGSVLRYVDTQTGIDKEFVVENYRVNVTNKQTLLVLEEDAPGLYPDDFIPTQGDITPNTSLPDITNLDPVADITYTATPDSHYRQGYISWTHPVPGAVTKYRLAIWWFDDPGSVEVFEPYDTTFDIANRKIGAYNLQITALNRWDKSSPPVTAQIAVVVPVTPPAAPGVTLLPGKVLIDLPAPANPGTTYEWYWSLSNNLATATAGGTNSKIELTGVTDGATYYVWYRSQFNDTYGDWVQVIIPDVVGISASQVGPGFFDDLVIPDIDTSELERQIDELASDQIFDVVSRAQTVMETAKQSVENLNIKQRATNVELSATENAQAIAAVQLSVANTNTSLASTIDRVDQVEIDAEGNAQAIAAVQLSVANTNTSLTSTIDRVDQVELDAEGNAQAIAAVQLSVANTNTSLTSTIDRVSAVELDADNNAFALDAITAIVEDPTNGLSATFTKASQAEIISGQNAMALIAQQASVDDLNTGLSATTLLAQQAKTTADGNSSAIVTAQSTANSASSTASSALSLAAAVDGDMDEIKAVAILVVQADGTAALIKIGATPTQSEIIFDAGVYKYKDGNGDDLFLIDAVTQRARFNGTVLINDLEGDVTESAYFENVHEYVNTAGNSTVVIADIDVPPMPFLRSAVFSQVPLSGDTEGLIISLFVNGVLRTNAHQSGSLKDGEQQSMLATTINPNQAVNLQIKVSNSVARVATVGGKMVLSVNKISNNLTLNIGALA